MSPSERSALRLRLHQWLLIAKPGWELPVAQKDVKLIHDALDAPIYEAEAEQLTRPLREQLAEEKKYHNKWVADHQVEIDRAHRSKREAWADRDAARQVGDVNAALCRDAEAKAAKLHDALSDLFSLIENGDLVRDITNDGQSNWALKMIPFMQALQKAQRMLET